MATWQGFFVLDIFPYGNVLSVVARASTTSDAFNAVAEPRRREILNYLALDERPVGDIVADVAARAAVGVEAPSGVAGCGAGAGAAGGGQDALSRGTPMRFAHCTNGREHSSKFWRNQLTRVKERAEERVARGAKEPETGKGSKQIHILSSHRGGIMIARPCR